MIPPALRGPAAGRVERVVALAARLPAPIWQRRELLGLSLIARPDDALSSESRALGRRSYAGTLARTSRLLERVRVLLDAADAALATAWEKWEVVGNADDPSLASGVTAVIFDRPATASIAIPGGAPGVRDTALLEPHMTVAQNVAFGLEERRVPRTEIEQRVAAALDHDGRQRWLDCPCEERLP